jgi:hypothetical protein
MAPPPTCGPGSLPQLLFQAAADSDLHLFNRNASALGAGRGHLREAVEAVKSPGAGALHVSAGRGRMPVCAYLVEELLVDVNASDDSGGFFVSSPSPSSRKSRILASGGNMIPFLDRRLLALLACDVKFAEVVLQRHHIVTRSWFHSSYV